MKRSWKHLLIAAMGLSLLIGDVQASVVIAGTRVIFPGQDREVTLKISNNGGTPALVQAWLDNGNQDSSPDTIDVPFTISPAMFRLDPSKGQALRIISTGASLAQDKETLYWLNVLEVPPKAKAGSTESNKLQLAFRTRIKFMYRPDNLPGRSEDSPGQVRWEVVRTENGNGYALKATNPTPYFVNLGEISLVVKNKAFDAGAGFIAPGDVTQFPIVGLTQSTDASAEVNYLSINDFGGGVKGKYAVGLSSK